MAKVELLTVYNEDGRPAGTKTRSQVHEDGDWHMLVFVLAARIATEGRRVLLQVRSGPQDPYEGQIDVSAAGHVHANESPREAAVREIREEVGIDLLSDDLISLGVRRLTNPSGVCKKAIQNFFLCLRPIHLEQARFNSEVGGFLEVDLDEFADFIDAKRDRLPAQARLRFQDGKAREMEITRTFIAAYSPMIIDTFRRFISSIKHYMDSGVADALVWE